MASRKTSLSDRQSRHDPAWKRAKQEKYAGRAIYKLEDIDRKFRLFRRSKLVLDLGCWPGSWMQYALEKSDEIQVVGVDLREVELAFGDRVTSIVGDVYKLRPDAFVRKFGSFDLVMSDMAPHTTGDGAADVYHSEQLFGRALEIASGVLRPGGHFVGKLFQGPCFADCLAQVKSQFHEGRAYRSRLTRSGSKEQYLIGRGFRAPPPASSERNSDVEAVPRDG